MAKIPTVAVLMGGPSAEHEISLASGAAMLEALRERRAYAVRPVVMTKDREWFVGGEPVRFGGALSDVDAALLAFHGEWGEDGTAQALLDWAGVPYNGSSVFASTLAMDKPRASAVLREYGLTVPYGKVYPYPGKYDRMGDLARLVVAASHLPVVVKPAARGSSVGVSIVRHPSEMEKALRHAYRYDDRVLMEDYHAGTEVSCGVLDNGTGRMIALPVAQIIPPAHKGFFDYDAKYSGESQEIVPASLPKVVVTRAQKAALAAHKALGCRHYSRTDMMLANGQFIVLEVNTLPGMTPESIFPKQAAALGISFPELIDRFVTLALRDRNK